MGKSAAPGQMQSGGRAARDQSLIKPLRSLAEYRHDLARVKPAAFTGWLDDNRGQESPR